MARIPKIWQQEIDKGTAFGERASAAVSKMPAIEKTPKYSIKPKSPCNCKSKDTE